MKADASFTTTIAKRPTREWLLHQVELFRIDASRQLDPQQRIEFGQFLTPLPVAALMASLFRMVNPDVQLLDAGAGVGSLTAALVADLCRRPVPPRSISVLAYEIDSALAAYLNDTLTGCARLCAERRIVFNFELRQADFLIEAATSLLGGFLHEELPPLNCAILNPPYRKINSDSPARLALRAAGIETSNLYTAFLALAIRLLQPHGEMVTITPRSFCNGPYFKPFRQILLDEMAIQQIHMFESRSTAFQDDEVLQENVILHATKQNAKPRRVIISISLGPDAPLAKREAPYSEIVHPGDPQRFIHVVPDDHGRRVSATMRQLSTRLADLGLAVSTGRVVDFRARDFLRHDPGPGTVPLIYPGHFENGFVVWPRPGGKKPNALIRSPQSEELLVPSGVYVLVKRFSSKEEPRRVVAAVYDPDRIHGSDVVGFENHLNYFHAFGEPLPRSSALGLTAFLNSRMLDLYFRQFNGHTQVNASDLRNILYPSLDQLQQLGEFVQRASPSPAEVDAYLEERVLTMVAEPYAGKPSILKKKIDAAIEILTALGFPREQLNERSALTLLALLDLKPRSRWSSASAPRRGITEMMDFFAEHYGKQYKPNTRETVRRQTMHQFVEAGIAIPNPDKPDRAINSPGFNYQIENGALELIRTFGTAEWARHLATYLASVQTLKARYAQERAMKQIPLTLPGGERVTLSPGGQNILIEQIIAEFCPRFVPGGQVLYIGDTDTKWAVFHQEQLEKLGVTVEAHGKMPDVVVHHTANNWLLLIEAVTSHGPVDPKRQGELKRIFQKSKAGLVFVTAFLSRKALLKYLASIAWETEVWVAESPDHMIHFNGERFLGPYSDTKS